MFIDGSKDKFLSIAVRYYAGLVNESLPPLALASLNSLD